MNIKIGIHNMGLDTGPYFDLYSNLDDYQVPFETNVSKVDLSVGYETTAPTGSTISTIIRVKSKGECETYIDIPILEPTTTTTTTLPPETTTTTTTSTTTTTTSTTTLPPETTTTTTTSTTTLPPSTTTTTTVLNKVLTITNVQLDEGEYLVHFTSNFALTQLSIQTSSNGVNWSIPQSLNNLSPQPFIPVPHINSFYVRLFDSNLGVITYSNVYQYFVPSTTTTTTTTLPTIKHYLQMSAGTDNPYSINCSTSMSLSGYRYTIETPSDDYPQPGEIIYNSNGTPFNGGNKYYRIQFALLDMPTGGESIIAKVATNGVIYATQQICS